MIAPPARLELALAPTPLLRLDRLSRRLGVELYVKRDDLTGLLESGSKVRKLEFLVGEALQQGADTLITCGPPDSNGCRAVAAVAARLGLRAVLVIRGERPPAYDGNLLLGRLLGAETRYCPGAEPARAGELMAALAAEVRAGGGRPYVIPESGAGELGALGYVECAVELSEQIHHGAPRFDAVVISAGSGGSHAGLLMGKQLAGLPGEVVGVPVEAPVERVRAGIVATMSAAIQRFGFAIEVPKTIHLLDGYQAAGRAEVADAELDVIVRLAREEGLLLDPVYTAKGFRGLVETLSRDPKALGQRVCFIHTGGLFSLFPLKDRLSRAIEQGEARPKASRADT
ncbi:MAG TPA: pyridoxal-phosphate dependent enzyme [Candidatus Deferrimicrobiaceae bacterium]|nr:pyridoxal-phosphate dependent enzyme [Candidatus Deferrimicrobiaceae bacterium]